MPTKTPEKRPDPAIAHVAALLCHQIEECHAMVISVFNYARNQDRIMDDAAKMDAMKTATRLMQAAAAAASALKRLHGTESFHRVTSAVEGGYPTPEKSKTNSGEFV